MDAQSQPQPAPSLHATRVTTARSSPKADLGSQVVAVRRLGSRRTARRRDVQHHRHGQNERRGSSSLAGRRPDPHCRAPDPKARRTSALELAISSSVCQSGSLTLAAITAVFTINYVAEMLGEDEDWPYDLSIDMFAEDGCLRVYGVGEDGVTAFTEYGIECPRFHQFFSCSMFSTLEKRRALTNQGVPS